MGAWLSRTAAAACGLSGWRRSVLAFGLGVLLSAALPPAHALPVLPVAFGGLLLLIAASRNPWRAAIAGWWFGFGHFLTSIYWIGASLLVDAERFGWLVVPAVVGLSAGFALFPAAAALLARLWPGAGWQRALALAVTWVAAEWVRGHILTGFPMNPIGVTWAISDGMIQVTALTGIFGLSFITVFASALPVTRLSVAGRTEGGRPWMPGALAIAILAAIWVGGVIRIAAVSPDAGPDPAVQLRIVQGNIAQRMKWADGERERAVRKYIALSREPAAEPIDTLVWPETAIPYYFPEQPGVFADVAAHALQSGVLVTGAPRIERHDDGPALWNSLFVISSDAEILGAYDKHHLVPFGEFVPLREFLGLERIVAGAVDFSAGPGPRTLAPPGVPPFSPLICYEGIFPGAAVGVGPRPRWLLNVTNDAWFGHTAGPYQHFQAVRIRAVEEGLPLVRAANTGISAVIDSFGRIEARLGLGRAGVVDHALPPPLAGLTPYAALGDWVLLIAMLLCCAGPAIDNLRLGIIRRGK